MWCLSSRGRLASGVEGESSERRRKREERGGDDD